MSNNKLCAPGAPGIPGKWTSSAKSGIGKSISADSQVSFTISHGILNEVYYPREDNACIRDMEFIVTDGKSFFSEEKRDAQSFTKVYQSGIPAYTISSIDNEKHYTLQKEIIADPFRNTVLQKIKFTSLKGKSEDYQLFVLLAPHISNQGAQNNGWTGEYKGVEMLFAERNGITLALACQLPFIKRSIGYVGISDGFQDISQHFKMNWEYTNAGPGNIALTAQIGMSAAQEEFTLALAFGRNQEEAAQHARASLLQGFEATNQLYINQWEEWHNTIHKGKSSGIQFGKLFNSSIAIMRMHESFNFPGAVIASLSIPWGNNKGDGDIGGYHLVWPRDLVECSGGFLAFGAKDDALRILNYLMSTQEADGHWPQNMWLEGNPYWNGLQLDQVAFPILLIGNCVSKNILDKHLAEVAWKTVRKAATFLLNYGPISPQERWEEESGISISTISTCIAALLVAADFATRNSDIKLAQICKDTADNWNSNIENWLYVTGTPLAEEVGVEGYYIRINPTGQTIKNLDGYIIGLKNRPDDKKNIPVNELVSVDALALVRFGLRKADDPRILNTIKVIDAKLKIETPFGPCWHRYNNDGYGEHEDGAAFDGTGIGRAWPLLTGERAHYEVAIGNITGAQSLMKTMEDFSSNELFPEQIWDAPEIPDKGLFLGRPSGSAMPLAWAHAEYIKLCASIIEKKVFDMPDHTIDRYIRKKTKSKLDIWRFMMPCEFVRKGNIVRIETNTAAMVHWSTDNWVTMQDSDSVETGFGLYYTDIPSKLLKGEKLDFTFYWPESGNWENKNYTITILN